MLNRTIIVPTKIKHSSSFGSTVYKSNCSNKRNLNSNSKNVERSTRVTSDFLFHKIEQLFSDKKSCFLLVLKILFIHYFLMDLLVVKNLANGSFKFRAILTCLQFNHIIFSNFILIEGIVCHDF